MADVFLDPFARRLVNDINDDIEARSDGLAHGSAKLTTNDASSVAEKYSFILGQISAFEIVIAMCRQIENENQGGRPAEVIVRER
jgi:hypothetical protein